MLLFRSEEHVEAWNEARQATRGGTMSLEQLWEVAQKWYAGRFEPDWEPRRVEESQAILTAAGLTDPFWQLQP